MAAKILIVEDEILVALELEAVLEDLGHKVVGIAPELDAAMEFASPDIDLALVDLNLRDGLTGPEIGRRLCENCGISVLFVTANPGLLGKGISKAIGVVTKPACENDVKAAVDYALRVRRGEHATPPGNLRAFA